MPDLAMLDWRLLEVAHRLRTVRTIRWGCLPPPVCPLVYQECSAWATSSLGGIGRLGAFGGCLQAGPTNSQPAALSDPMARGALPNWSGAVGRPQFGTPGTNSRPVLRWA